MKPPTVPMCFCILYSAFAFLAGCFQPEPLGADGLRRGYVLLLPGVECTTSSMEGIYRGVRDAGEDRAVDLDIWGYRPFGTFRNLPAYQLNRKRAARMAVKLVEYRERHPEAPVSIIGFSGGGAMAIFTAEALPDGYALDRIVLLGAAISPQYDLTTALARAHRGIVNFHSSEDWFMAGWATETFGTMDRVKTQTAGRCGFLDTSGDLRAARGLTQVAWCPDWKHLGHDGGHSGWLSRAWAREVLAPVVRIAPPASQPGL